MTESEQVNVTTPEELETSIFNLVVTLYHYKIQFMASEKAKEEIADYLESLCVGLRSK